MFHFNNLIFIIIIFPILYLFRSGETKCIPCDYSSASTPPEAAPPRENSVPASQVTATPIESPHKAAEATPLSSQHVEFGHHLFGAKPPMQGAPNAALKRVCASTDYPALCLSTLTPFLSGNALHGDPITLLQAAIKAAMAETKLIMGIVEKLINEPGKDLDMLSSLKDCKDNYSDALDNYQEAMDAIPSRDIGTINSMLSAAVTDYSTSDDEFSEGQSPMKDHDARLMNMAGNCLAIASLIK